MKKGEVPQDKSPLGEANIKELCYAVDENGEYTTALSSGWEPKAIVQQETMNLYNERIEEARQQVMEGKASPVVYYMELQRMDWTTLAGYMGLWTWRCKRHGKPNVFRKLNTKTIDKYAKLFGITSEELIAFNKK